MADDQTSSSHPGEGPEGGRDSEAPPGGDGGGKPVARLADFFWLGTAVAISVIAGGAIGYALDSWLGTTPWLTFAGLAFGIVAAVAMAVNQLRRFL